MSTEKPRRASGTICPLMRKDVSKCCHTCEWYTQILGTNPQTSEPIDKWGCAIAFMPMLTIENSQQQRQTGAAVESFRNEMRRQNAAMAMIAGGGGPRIVSQRQINLGGGGSARPLLGEHSIDKDGVS